MNTNSISYCKSYVLLINIMKLFGLVSLLLVLLVFADSKCVNTTNFKYDLHEVA
jgi:hypothetical protein